jgi:hypothetical protein
MEDATDTNSDGNKPSTIEKLHKWFSMPNANKDLDDTYSKPLKERILTWELKLGTSIAPWNYRALLINDSSSPIEKILNPDTMYPDEWFVATLDEVLKFPPLYLDKIIWAISAKSSLKGTIDGILKLRTKLVPSVKSCITVWPMSVVKMMIEPLLADAENLKYNHSEVVTALDYIIPGYKITSSSPTKALKFTYEETDDSSENDPTIVGVWGRPKSLQSFSFTKDVQRKIEHEAEKLSVKMAPLEVNVLDINVNLIRHRDDEYRAMAAIIPFVVNRGHYITKQLMAASTPKRDVSPRTLALREEFKKMVDFKDGDMTKLLTLIKTDSGSSSGSGSSGSNFLESLWESAGMKDLTRIRKHTSKASTVQEMIEGMSKLPTKKRDGSYITMPVTTLPFNSTAVGAREPLPTAVGAREPLCIPDVIAHLQRTDIEKHTTKNLFTATTIQILDSKCLVLNIDRTGEREPVSVSPIPWVQRVVASEDASKKPEWYHLDTIICQDKDSHFSYFRYQNVWYLYNVGEDHLRVVSWKTVKDHAAYTCNTMVWEG